MSIQRVALRGTPEIQALRHAESINGLIDGRLDVTGSVTLTANSATTTVVDNKFQSQMVPVFTPTTANAAGAVATLRVTSRINGGFTLTHANTATSDRSFLYVRFG